MKISDLITRVQKIVATAALLKDKHIKYKDIPVNYACIFSQNEIEYSELNRLAAQIGKIIKDTPSGYLYHIKPIATAAGNLLILKIRKPDPTKPERGDADFTLPDFDSFKAEYLGKPGYKLIPKDSFVMVELMDPDFDVRVYFSNPPLDVQFGLK